MSLTTSDELLAREIFYKLAKYDFAYGYYETPVTVMSTTTAGSGLSAGITHIVPVKHTTCKASIPGLDYSTFLDAIDKFLELSRAKLFDVLADDTNSNV